MLPLDAQFTFRHDQSDIIYGRDSIHELERYLGAHDLGNGLVVCGSNVGANGALMTPLLDGGSHRIADVFDGTTSDKSIEDVYAGIDVIRDADPDVLIAVGGGSSLDVARQMSVFHSDGRSIDELKSAACENDLSPPGVSDTPLPVIVVPTTFAGAADSAGGSMIVLSTDESPTEQPIRIGGSVRPIAMFYDPNLFETTPMSVLAGSAMNGFNKGLETIYSSESNPITDATAMHGLRLLQSGFTQLANNESSGMDESVLGTILVQFERNTNVIHAFGHGFSRRYPVQQGKIHAIVAPHVLRYLFDEIDGRRNMIAHGLNISVWGSEKILPERIINEVSAIRDQFNLPTQLRELDSIDTQDFPDVAEFIVNDPPMEQAPILMSMDEDDVVGILNDAW